MTWFRALIAILFLTFSTAIRADGPDDDYVRAYHLILDGDQLRGTSQADLSRTKYLEAQAILKKIQMIYPAWSPKAVQFRISYIDEKLSGAPSAKPEPAPAESTARPPARPVPVAPSQPIPAPQPAPDQRDGQIQQLNEAVTRLQADNSVLQAKLKEALGAQPALVDPKDLARAEERIRSLEKEKDLLKITLDQEEASKSKLVDPAALEKVQTALNDTKKELAEQTSRLSALAQEKTILEAKLTAAGQQSDATQALKQENDQLKKQAADAARTDKTAAIEKQLAAAQASAEELKREKAALQAARADKSAGTEKQLAMALASVEELKKEKAALQKEKAIVEARLNAPAVAAPSPSESSKVKQLEKERDDLIKKLNGTSRDITDKKSRGKTPEIAQLTNQIAVLRARLEVFEARKSAYTEEELALFKAPTVEIAEAAPKSAKKTARELPAGAGGLATEAQRAFAAHRYDEAEQKYLQVLKLDDKNVFTLGNLAATQLEQNRFDDAETNLKKALSEDAGDPYSLSLLGIVKFREGKFDEALDLLSKAAAADPQNPETQNYLGITLSQKGQRAPAEAALRKAIQIAPNYAGAHHNLAVIYATQQPPSMQLARWHYDKAIAAGHPRNADLEKMLEKGNAK